MSATQEYILPNVDFGLGDRYYRKTMLDTGRAPVRLFVRQGLGEREALLLLLRVLRIVQRDNLLAGPCSLK